MNEQGGFPQQGGLFFSFSFFFPLINPRTALALPPSSNSDPGSQIAGSPLPLANTVSAFSLIARRTQYFLPSSIRVEELYSSRIPPVHWAALLLYLTSTTSNTNS